MAATAISNRNLAWLNYLLECDTGGREQTVDLGRIVLLLSARGWRFEVVVKPLDDISARRSSLVEVRAFERIDGGLKVGLELGAIQDVTKQGNEKAAAKLGHGVQRARYRV